MGEEDDQQKLKKVAASSYEYDRDPRWADYWSNILIPPHLASRSDLVVHFKHKFYQRYVDPDFVVEPMPSSSSPQPAKQSAPSSSFPQSQNVQGRSHSGSVNRGTTTPTSTNSPSSFIPRDGRTVQFSINAWVFVVAALALFPLMPRNLTYRAYKLSFMGTTCSSLYSLYSLYGKPQAWNLQAIQTWFQPIIVANDFIYSVYSLIFVGSDLTLKFALIPVLCRSVAIVAKFLRCNFSHSSFYRKYLEDPSVWVDSNATTLSILSSHTEVVLGFLMILSLFSWQRNFIQAFMYWQLLKLMYHAPATAGYHRSVWSKMGRAIYPLVHRYAPILNTPMSILQRWWLR